MRVAYQTCDEIQIEPLLQSKWQKILDLLVEITENPIALIMRAHASDMEVLLKSRNPQNMFREGDRLSIDSNLYCEAVMRTGEPLIVTNGLKDKKWVSSPGVKSGLIAYMGFPIVWPAGELFGTICVMDTKERDFRDNYKKLLAQYAEVIQDDLAALINQRKLETEALQHKSMVRSLQESEERFRKAFVTSQAGIIITQFETGKIIDANEGYALISGYPRDELIGKTTQELNLYCNPEERAQIIQKIQRNEPIRRYEMSLRAKSGDHRTIQGAVERIELAGQHCLITTIYDITHLKKLEHNLQAQNQRYALAIRSADMGIWDWDIANNVLYWEDEMYRLYDLRKDEFTSTFDAWSARLHPEDCDGCMAVTERALLGEDEYDTEFRIVCPGGKVKYIKAYGDIIRDGDGKAIRMVGVNYDITEKKRLMQEIQNSELRYKSIFQNNHAVQLIIDCETGDIFDANPAACAFYGIASDEFRTKKIWDINPSSIGFIMDKLKHTYEKGFDLIFTRHRRYDGEVRDVEVSSGRIDMDGHKLIYAIVHDITERKLAETKLQESERRFRLLVESAPDCIFVQTDSRLAYVNHRMVEMFGAKSEAELLGRYIPDMFSQEFREAVKGRIQIINEQLSSVPLTEEKIVRLDGTTVDVEVSAVPFQYDGRNGALVYMRDITERKVYEKAKADLEMQLRQKQKLESIGTLAGGVAHEINNPINGIINYAQLIAEDAAASERTKEFSEEIIHEGDRIAEIVKNLLDFSRLEKQTHSPAQISDIINHTISLIRNVMRHDQITLKINIPEGLPSIKCRSQQIQQVIMNLVTNARDALNVKYKGYHEDKKILLDCSMFRRGGRRWFRITVEDHGTGIPDEVMEKIFDPFFTTKPRDIGTGLGLSVSHSIVKDHHGELYFETSPGMFTRAILELPVDNGWSLDE